MMFLPSVCQLGSVGTIHSGMHEICRDSDGSNWGGDRRSTKENADTSLPKSDARRGDQKEIFRSAREIFSSCAVPNTRDHLSSDERLPNVDDVHRDVQAARRPFGLQVDGADGGPPGDDMPDLFRGFAERHGTRIGAMVLSAGVPR
jgi:hypothetical protein